MPKISKVKVVNSRPGSPTPPKEKLDKYMCTRCGKIFVRQKNNFSISQSPLFRENNGYLPVCCHCMDDLLAHYKSVLGDEKSAMRRICMKFDIYWHPEIFDMVYRANTNNSRVRSYISKTNLIMYAGKTYDDTVDEEGTPVVFDPAEIAEAEAKPEERSDYELDPDVVQFWGGGFMYDFYAELEHRYARWTADLQKPLDTATEALYKQICILEATINRNTAAGKPVEQSVNALNSLLGSLNAKPIQKKQDEALDAPFDSTPFGVGIRMCENTRPIPKPDPRFNDVDGIVKYVTIWFLGHLCKMLGIKNTYCKLYDQEIARMRVERPELEDEDDEDVFNDIFGDTHT